MIDLIHYRPMEEEIPLDTPILLRTKTAPYFAVVKRMELNGGTWLDDIRSEENNSDLFADAIGWIRLADSWPELLEDGSWPEVGL